MTQAGVSWRNAKIPSDTAVFAIGDVHSHNELLEPLLKSIQDKIDALPVEMKAQIIFIGDYIDRGPNTPHTVDLLLKFREEMTAKKAQGRIADVTFLCGNHDEVFKRLLEIKTISDAPLPAGVKESHHAVCLTDAEGAMNLRGFEAWLKGGGGLETIRQYYPPASLRDLDAFDENAGRFRRREDGKCDMMAVNRIVDTLKKSVPDCHKKFFEEVYKNSHAIIGDYLFTHAGVDPDKTLQAQGIGEGATPLSGGDYLDFLMLRNEFLWRNDNNLPCCPYVVVHGHTPSAIGSELIATPGKQTAETPGSVVQNPEYTFARDPLRGWTVADGQKDYRLCLDTDVYKPGGALTCFVRCGNDAPYFIAVRPEDLHHAIEYSIPPVGGQVAALFHKQHFSQHYPVQRCGA